MIHNLPPAIRYGLAAALLLCAGSPALALDANSCAAFHGQTIYDVEVTKAEWMKVGEDDICVVSGLRAPYLDIEVTLPADWSGRSFQLGGGGFDGNLVSALKRAADSTVTSLDPIVAEQHAAYIGSNGGNRAGVDGEAAPGVWFSGTPEGAASLLDYSYLALVVAKDFGRALVEQAYGRPADHNYFYGCSNGGRNAYIMAQRFPEDFDGIISGCEPMDMASTVTSWMSLGRLAGSPAMPSAEQFKFAFSQALEACDGTDGIVDGTIADAASCGFTPDALACTINDAAQCFSDAQIGTMEMLMSDIRDADEVLISMGFAWADFSTFGPAFGALGSVYAAIGSGDPAWLSPAKQATYDVDKNHYEIGLGLLRKGLDHDMIGIAQYVAGGGKLLSWHAGNDNLLPASDHEMNFGKMLQTAKILARGTGIDVTQNARFFIVPGVAHGQGQHPAVNYVPAIIEWVENGNPPAVLSLKRDGQPEIPVCAGGNYPRYENGAYSCMTR